MTMSLRLTYQQPTSFSSFLPKINKPQRWHSYQMYVTPQFKPAFMSEVQTYTSPYTNRWLCVA